MSSRELLVLLRELPETSRFKEATQRTFRVVEAVRGDHKGKLFLTPALGRMGPDVKLVAEFVDWTYDRKLLARNTRELAALRNDGRDSQPDFTGLLEPLQQILADRAKRKRDEMRARGESFIRSGLYGYERR